ncbi:MAG: membrane protein insertase YidC, partial [Arenimonas sp.]|nr:membrane protein insertase YidC [Arenimonas sp.]
MNQTRSFLLIAWLVVATFLWIEWSKAPAPGAAATSVTNSASATPTLPGATPGAALPAPGDATALPAAGPQLPAIGAAPIAVGAPTQVITIANDVLRLTVDLHGGRLIDSQLLQFTLEKTPDSPNVQLLASAPALYYVADAGLISVDGKNPQRELDVQFRTLSAATDFTLAPGAGAIDVPLLWTDPASGISVRRTLRLSRGSYVLGLTDQVSNNGASAHRIYPFVGLSRVAPPPPPRHSFMTSPETFSFVGAAWYTPEDKFRKAAFSDFLDEKPPASEVQGVWIGMLQHHFATAWVPRETDQQVRLETSVGTHDGVPLYSIRSIAAPLDVAPGASSTHLSRLWVGPKLQAPMAKLAPSLKLIVDYGVFTFIAQPLFWLLSWLHLLFGNWGWAIIAIVVLLKLALYPLSAKQYQSMAKMRAVQPRIEALKERYGDDKQQFQVAMMELYKKEKINPIGGCLPMLIPIPIFLGLYWVLLETVELRHAPWVGWIQNLTAADPYFILPAMNLIVMYLTQKLTPMPGMDPLQKKMMQFMPLVFGVMIAFFPSGLVLYWVTNGLR